MSSKIPCAKCGALILPATAERTGGMCMPCKQGRRREESQVEIPSTYWQEIESAYSKVSIYDGAEALSKGLADFPPYVGDLLAVHWLMYELQNGGLSQFFLNPTGVLAPEAVKALSNMGLDRAAGSLHKACAKFGMQYPRPLRDREKFLFHITGVNDACEVMRLEPFQEQEELFEQMERRIYARMNSYADEKKANK